MCLAIPGRVTTIEDEGLFRQGMVKFGALSKRVNLTFVPEATEGSWVLIHAGVAISQIDEGQAERLLKELDSLEEES